MPPSTVRIRILEAAERLFAEFGIEGVSLRQIAAAAGQRNTSAVAYHFGSKAGLVAALYEWRMAPVNARRLELLAAAGSSTVETCVRGLVMPLADVLTEAEAAGRPSWYLRFLAEAMRYPEYDPETVALIRPEAESIRELIVGLLAETAQLGLPPGVFAQRMRLLALLVITTLADRERLGGGAGDLDAPGAAVSTEVLIAAGTAILSGPATPADATSTAGAVRVRRPLSAKATPPEERPLPAATPPSPSTD